MRANRYPVGTDVPGAPLYGVLSHKVYWVCSHSLSASFDSREVPSEGEAEGLSSTN